MSNLKFAGTWKNRDATVKVKLAIISFEEDNSIICYCPALDLAGYGEDEKSAAESFSLALGEFLDYTLKKKTLKAELLRLGWKVTNNKRRPMKPPVMQDLLRSNQNFSRIFDNHDFKKISKSIEMPSRVGAMV
jgi:hypothetical protein